MLREQSSLEAALSLFSACLTLCFLLGAGRQQKRTGDEAEHLSTVHFEPS